MEVVCPSICGTILLLTHKPSSSSVVNVQGVVIALPCLCSLIAAAVWRCVLSNVQQERAAGGNYWIFRGCNRSEKCNFERNMCTQESYLWTGKEGRLFSRGIFVFRLNMACCVLHQYQFVGPSTMKNQWVCPRAFCACTCGMFCFFTLLTLRICSDPYLLTPSILLRTERERGEFLTKFTRILAHGHVCALIKPLYRMHNMHMYTLHSSTTSTCYLNVKHNNILKSM